MVYERSGQQCSNRTIDTGPIAVELTPESLCHHPRVASRRQTRQPPRNSGRHAWQEQFALGAGGLANGCGDFERQSRLSAQWLGARERCAIAAERAAVDAGCDERGAYDQHLGTERCDFAAQAVKETVQRVLASVVLQS